jgi:hypothetical protein
MGVNYTYVNVYTHALFKPEKMGGGGPFDPSKRQSPYLSQQLLLQVPCMQLHQLPVVGGAWLHLQAAREFHDVHALHAHGQLPLPHRLGEGGALMFFFLIVWFGWWWWCVFGLVWFGLVWLVVMGCVCVYVSVWKNGVGVD